jgi:hypothetical protein
MYYCIITDTSLIYVTEGDSVKLTCGPCRKHPKSDECEYSDGLTRSRDTQVATYVNRRVGQNFSIFLDSAAFRDPNILSVRLAENATNHSVSIVNVYNNRSSKHRALANTMQHLIANLEAIKDVGVLQGDFNLHHQEWDNVVVNDTDADAEALMQATFLADLTLR